LFGADALECLWNIYDLKGELFESFLKELILRKIRSRQFQEICFAFHQTIQNNSTVNPFINSIKLYLTFYQ
jgi:hypothetical protein